ncbi:uncharacterized protein LOC127259994 [Andrographis paniculata]|uniref:uncharacterized protein LOC127259994 n=1 Tax=Andrographis paniculata TaxID=175694 RepID=UPI0021E961B8|nr:uncharacterized protein LOC127259994 [Andrographis paniculata]
MEISGSFICRALLFTGVLFYFTFLLLTSNRYGCPSQDAVVSPLLRPATSVSGNDNGDEAIANDNIDRQKPTLVATNEKDVAVASDGDKSVVSEIDKNITAADGVGVSSGRNDVDVGVGVDLSVDRDKKSVVDSEKKGDGGGGGGGGSSAAVEVRSPTQLKHVVFGIVGSEKAWHQRKVYIESWWRPNATRGYLFLDTKPSEALMPWSPASPPYKVSADLKKFLNKPDVTPQRIANGIREVFNAEHEDIRWLVMGDDDSIIFLDNMIELLNKYDHTKYYYLGARSEFVLSNFLFSFAQGFGGASFVLSYPLAKALAKDMDRCLLKYGYLIAADQTAMSCIADLGISLTEHPGFHQIDLRGDLSGFLSSHPNAPLISLHHFDMLDPIFPNMDRYESTRHLMKAAEADQPRMLQQTVCYYHKYNWTFSISWGYSVHIYERIMPRSILQYPIETFRQWLPAPGPPFYMFNTRLPSQDPCEAPHVFYFQAVEKSPQSNVTNTNYARSAPRGMPACAFFGNHSADFVTKIRVYSPANKRKEVERSECCDVIGLSGNRAKIKYRECRNDDVLI